MVAYYLILAPIGQVLGKLSFATFSGSLIDVYGMVSVYALFALLAAATLPVLSFMPDLTRDDAKKEMMRGETEEDKNKDV